MQQNEIKMCPSCGARWNELRKRGELRLDDATEPQQAAVQVPEDVLHWARWISSDNRKRMVSPISVDNVAAWILSLPTAPAPQDAEIERLRQELATLRTEIKANGGAQIAYEDLSAENGRLRTALQVLTEMVARQGGGK